MLTVLGAGAADARGTFDKTTAPTDTDVSITVTATVEELVGYNEKVTVEVPDGFRVLSCGTVTGFTCTVTAVSSPKHTLVTWENTAPSGQEFLVPTSEFPFRMRTIATAGKYRFDVNQFYSNGNEVHSDGPEGSPNAAPFLTITGGTAPTTPTTSVPQTPSASSSEFPVFTPDASPIDSFAGSTPTTVMFDTTPTTQPAQTSPDLAIDNVASEGKGIRGAERLILLALAALAVGFPLFNTLRERANA